MITKPANPGDDAYIAVSNRAIRLIYVMKTGGKKMVFAGDLARGFGYLFIMTAVGVITTFTALPLYAQETTTSEAASEEPAAPRGTNLSLGAFKVSADLPIEVVSDELQMDQNVSIAIFKGNVQVEHGDMILNCDTVEVEYGTPEGSTKSNQILRITATGNVRMISPTETAESDEAVYTLATRQIVMTDNVVVTQGPNTVSGERMVVFLDDGTAQMQGRVRTTIGPGKPKAASPEGTGDNSE